MYPDACSLRPLRETDISLIVRSFAEHNWPKPRSSFEHYLQEQEAKTRCIWLAFLGESFAGYVTLSLNSHYEPFRAQGIPEIMDLNVLPPYRRRGVGSALLERAEQEAAKHSNIIGIGVGLYPDYGSAQRLYFSRGYCPDGRGITHRYALVDPGANVCVDDDLVLWCTKKSSPEDRFPYQVVDLTHTVSSSIPTWEGGCGFLLHTTQDYKDVGFRIQRFEMVAGIGTHMDAPCHQVAGGGSIDDLPLSDLIAPCVVIDVSSKVHERYKVSVEDILEFEKEHGKIPGSSFVILRTGWDRFWDTPEKYRNNLVFPSVSVEAATALLQRGICGLGIDTLSPDSFDGGFDVHSTLLGAKKYIVENIANSSLLPPTGSSIVCAPIKVEGGAEAPVRLIGLLQPGRK
jgi:kynurenine formamidase/GNAT superfamily N-acetyltransferase